MSKVNEVLMGRREEAKTLLNRFATVQERAEFDADVIACPRCGNHTMFARLHDNPDSNNYDGMVCHDCGVEENREEAGKQPRLELEDWALVEKYHESNLDSSVEEAG